MLIGSIARNVVRMYLSNDERLKNDLLQIEIQLIHKEPGGIASDGRQLPYLEYVMELIVYASEEK